MQITDKLKKDLLKYLKKNKKADLVSLYLHYLELTNKLSPVLFPKKKTIYQDIHSLIDLLEEKNELCRETEIKIQFGKQSVNEYTKKVYICPFTGTVFGDNTHPDPQDAIYDWVSKCPENTERKGGLKAKRFFVSEDPEIIQNYIKKRREPISKTVYSSVITGKLFNSKKAVINDLKTNHIKKLTLFDVQNQNKFDIEIHFLDFLQDNLTEEKIQKFVELLSKFSDFETYLSKWVD